MKIIIDTEQSTLTEIIGGKDRTINLYTKEAFEIISDRWVQLGWQQKYSHTFSWMGRPIIQLPEDMIRMQEVIYQVKPDVIIETGIAHGGSLIYYASLCKAVGNGRVIGIDIEIRSHNRKEIEEHEFYPLITLIEGSSTDPVIVDRVKSLVKPHEKVLVILDSCHTKSHVADELLAYYEMVTLDSYIVATDGVMQDLYDVPRGNSEWKWDHPSAAAAEFALAHPDFIIEQPAWIFNESELDKNITHWPNAWLRRIATSEQP